MGRYKHRIVSFLLFGIGGTLGGIIINAIPSTLPHLGVPFFLGWWVAAALGSALLPRGIGNRTLS